jgi:hypothetical protein
MEVAAQPLRVELAYVFDHPLTQRTDSVGLDGELHPERGSQNLDFQAFSTDFAVTWTYRLLKLALASPLAPPRQRPERSDFVRWRNCRVPAYVRNLSPTAYS